MRKLLQINPVVRINTSTGRIMQEIGQLATSNGWECYMAYGRGRDGLQHSKSATMLPIGGIFDTGIHWLTTRLLDRHGLVSRHATKNFLARVEEIAPDVIHIHNIHGYFLNYPILFDFLRRKGIPVVWTVHDCWLYTGHCYYYTYAACNKWQNGCNHCPQRNKFPISWLIDRSKNNYRDKKKAFTSLPKEQFTIVPVSQWIMNEMSRSFLSDYNFRLIRNGIDTAVFKPYPSASDIRRRYGLDDKTIYMAAASIWSEEKGLNDIIEISKLLNSNEIIVMVGTTQEIRRKIDGMNIVAIDRTSNVKELAEIYSASSVFLNPTWQDNYPTVNMEAIACGTPVVTYRTGGSVEAITPTTGRIVDQGNISSMLSVARSLEKDKTNRALDCQAYALSHFKKENCYAEYIKLYNEIAQQAITR